jgi:hypothetical protein
MERVAASKGIELGDMESVLILVLVLVLVGLVVVLVLGDEEAEDIGVGASPNGAVGVGDVYTGRPGGMG